MQTPATTTLPRAESLHHAAQIALIQVIKTAPNDQRPKSPITITLTATQQRKNTKPRAPILRFLPNPRASTHQRGSLCPPKKPLIKPHSAPDQIECTPVPDGLRGDEGAESEGYTFADGRSAGRIGASLAFFSRARNRPCLPLQRAEELLLWLLPGRGIKAEIGRAHV